MTVVTFTVKDSVVVCGCNDHTAFNGQTITERIATCIFDDDFESGVNVTYSDLDEDLKSYSV